MSIEVGDRPVIMQGSVGARKYAGEPFLRHLVLAAVEAYPHIPVVMHQDHGASPAVCQRSIRSGSTSVMMDRSLEEDAKTPASYDYNVETTRRVVAMPHAVGVSVEGELGCLGSLEDILAIDRVKFLKAATDAARTLCRTRFEAFGSAGRAASIKPLPLDTMAERYAGGGA